MPIQNLVLADREVLADGDENDDEAFADGPTAGEAAAPVKSAVRKDPPARKLARDYFAFMRGLVQGIDRHTLWLTYLWWHGRYDAPTAQRTVDWIKLEFSIAARRHGKHGLARLIVFDPIQLTLPKPKVPAVLADGALAGGNEKAADQVPADDKTKADSKTQVSAGAGQGAAASPTSNPIPGNPSRPTFDEFSARYADFFSQSDMRAAYIAQHGPVGEDPDRRGARHARLIAKQLEALNWLESVVAEAPLALHPTESWFDPPIGTLLKSAGLTTLGQLVARINGTGQRWWAAIPGIGPRTGTRLFSWLSHHQETIGIAIGAHTHVPRRQLSDNAIAAVVAPATAVVPLDKFRVPAELDGSTGHYRAPPHQCLLQANNDYDAILAWLNSKQAGHTRRAYTKEAERLLLWAILERKKPISSLSVEDCLAYRDFLRDPLPSDRWCGERGRARWSPLWRPFNGPLTPSSERHALNVLTSLFRWLVDQRYVVGNPFQAVPPTLDATPKIQTGRSLTKKQWNFIQEFIDAQKDGGASRRLRIVLYLGYATGLRLAELAQIKCSDLRQQVFDDDQTGWMLSVLGKGHRLRDVPIPDTLLVFINQYLGFRGLIDNVSHPSNQDAYLIGKVDHPELRGQPGYDPKAGISVGTLAAQLKQFFYDAGKSLAKEHPQSGKRLQQASTHWLRHTHGSHAVASGTPIEIVQNNLGHANLATTTIYVTTEQKRRHAAMAKFWNQSGRAGG